MLSWLSVLVCLLSFFQNVFAQITIASVPSSGCDGKPFGSATYSTDLTLPTGSQRIVAGDFWQQAGAQWNFSTDTQGIEFSSLGIPGWGAEPDIPQADHDALKIDDSKTVWRLTLPTTQPSGGEYDIVFVAGPPVVSGAAQPTAVARRDVQVEKRGDSPEELLSRHPHQSPPTKTPVPELEIRGGSLSSRMRHRRQSNAGEFHLVIEGAVNCLQDSGGSPAEASMTSSPKIASLCANNEISTATQSWTAYGVQSYMSSLASAAAPAPTAPQVDGARLIHDDVNPPGAFCTYTAKCDSIGCKDVKESTSGTQLSVQRFLGYTAVVNLNNYLNSIETALLDSGTISSLINGKIVTTFFTNPAPDATWQQIMGIFTPLLGLFSALLGPFSAIGSAALGVASGIAGAVTAGGVASSIPPVADKRFDEYSDISGFIGDYLKSTVVGIEHAYNVTIGPDSSAVGWAGSDLAPEGSSDRIGFFGGGYWVDSDYTQGLSNNLLENFIRIFTYKAINFALVDSGCFIIYVPYGKPIKDTSGNVQQNGINQDYCEKKLKVSDNIGTLTVCDAPDGMARIINGGAISDGTSLLSGLPQGWDSKFSILPNEEFSIGGAIKGSVASWQTGDFGYDASNPFNDAFNSDNGLSDDQVTTLSRLVIAEETAGFFNIPVCETFDLRFFPLTSGSSCTACGLGKGGTSGSTKKFTDNVNDKVKDALDKAVPPDCVQAYTSTICSQQCPSDPFGG